MDCGITSKAVGCQVNGDKTEKRERGSKRESFYLFILGKKNIGLRFCMLDIQLVFLRIFGVGLNTQDSECMRNCWQMLFAAFFAFFVAGFLPRFCCASQSSSLPK